jgi:hypothetical protein
MKNLMKRMGSNKKGEKLKYYFRDEKKWNL